DKVIKEIESLGNNTYSVTGSLDFEEFCEFFKIKTETEMNSVGGFVMERLSKVPEKGDKFTFENLSITVTQTHEKRAEKIVVKVEK
ncbi:MAG: HlyC/CorC family transporter, partial [Clostridia bacterium]|nr:HlyC/CorC family transporter [Clostridia bacterium]